MQVLDEADRLLEKNFSEDLAVIFDALPKQRQTLLFSATLTGALKELQKLATRKPYFFEVTSEYEHSLMNALLVTSSSSLLVFN